MHLIVAGRVSVAAKAVQVAATFTSAQVTSLRVERLYGVWYGLAF